MTPIAERATVDVPPLAGYTVGITAARRAEELAVLLQRRGASVLHAPAIRIVPLPDDTELLAATRNVLAEPVDIVVATTGIGFRGWIEAADGWNLGAELSVRLAASTLLARGPKAKGAIRAAGLVESWSPESEASPELLEHLLTAGVAGKRVAVQLHGEPLTWFINSLRAAGADVVPVPVYRWTEPADIAPVERLLDATLAGQVDAIAFTSAPAAASLLAIAERGGRREELLRALGGSTLSVCVGAISAGPLAELGITVAQPDRARLGAMVRTLADLLPARAPRLRVGQRELQLRGQAVLVDGELRPVPPAPMAVLRSLAACQGRVVSRKALLAVLPAGGEEHAVETAVARLRTALGEPRLVQTVVKRGYRLAIEPLGDR
ncbi:MAG TPA: uroporphyrinogen-III synthase [Pseudonocardiaceae bacterium]|jgi:uroporphyrinogen-III synthase|nr:uroporphyrinogen-III synthase [Pseudonocardiaceae bacterium]